MSRGKDQGRQAREGATGADVDAATFGSLLRTRRRAAGMSQAELSRRTGLPKSVLSRYENDHVLPSLPTLMKLAESLGVPAAALLPDGDAGSADLQQALERRGLRVRTPEEAEHVADMVARSSEPPEETG